MFHFTFNMSACVSQPEPPTRQQVLDLFDAAQEKVNKITASLARSRADIERAPPIGFEHIERAMLVPVYMKLQQIHKELDKVVQ